MRAPTIEGYAARHSKLSKSVTFNRDTLQSPPNSANTVLGTPQSLFPFVNSPTDNGLDIKEKVSDIVFGTPSIFSLAKHHSWL